MAEGVATEAAERLPIPRREVVCWLTSDPRPGVRKINDQPHRKLLEASSINLKKKVICDFHFGKMLCNVLKGNYKHTSMESHKRSPSETKSEIQALTCPPVKQGEKEPWTGPHTQPTGRCHVSAPSSGCRCSGQKSAPGEGHSLTSGFASAPPGPPASRFVLPVP